MIDTAAFLAAVADALEANSALSARIGQALGATPLPDEWIPLAETAEHGAPSTQWVQDRARRGEIQILGPRGARFVRAADLRTLLAATTIARRSKPSASTSLADDARSAVVDLAARRRRRSA